MDRREIEAFLTLAEELHFGRTAERLQLTSARISQTIQNVERRIGTALFERSTRQVSLTPIGRQLREDLLPHHRGVQEAVAKAISAGRGIRGVLSVGFCGLMVGGLVEVIDAFRGVHPDCEVQIRELEPSDSHEPLRRGEVDVEITEFPVGEPDLTSGPELLVNPLVLAVASGHPLARQESVCVDDLARTTADGIPALPDDALDHFIPARSPNGRPVKRGPTAASWQELLTLVGTGKYVAVAGAWGIRYHGRPDITYLPFRDVPPVSYGLVWRPTREAGRIHAFNQFALDYLDERKDSAEYPSVPIGCRDDSITGNLTTTVMKKSTTLAGG